MTVILNFCSGSTAFWVGLSNQRLAPVRTKSSLKVSETLRAGSFWSTESMASLERLSNTTSAPNEVVLYTSLVIVNPLAEFIALCKFYCNSGFSLTIPSCMGRHSEYTAKGR